MLQTALSYTQAGLSVVPIASDGSKRTAPTLLSTGGSWKDYQERIADPNELVNWFGSYVTCGIAIICGKVSGHLECVDVDDSELIEEFERRARNEFPNLWEKLVPVRTPRPGLHLYYRARNLQGGRKLARRVESDAETGKLKSVTRIETRGEGNYAILPPSPPECHPSKRPYVFPSEKTFANLTEISDRERQMLHEFCGLFDQRPPRTQQLPASPPRNEHAGNTKGGRPGDAFNAQADWHDLLTPHGWVFADCDSSGVSHWTRPGKDGGTSATTGFAGLNQLYVFTSNAEPFEEHCSYSPFAALALLQFEGDFKKTAEHLRSQGYGKSSYSDRKTRPRRGRRRKVIYKP